MSHTALRRVADPPAARSGARRARRAPIPTRALAGRRSLAGGARVARSPCRSHAWRTDRRPAARACSPALARRVSWRRAALAPARAERVPPLAALPRRRPGSRLARASRSARTWPSTPTHASPPSRGSRPRSPSCGARPGRIHAERAGHAPPSPAAAIVARGRRRAPLALLRRRTRGGDDEPAIGPGRRAAARARADRRGDVSLELLSDELAAVLAAAEREIPRARLVALAASLGTTADEARAASWTIWSPTASAGLSRTTPSKPSNYEKSSGYDGSATQLRSGNPAAHGL